MDPNLVDLSTTRMKLGLNLVEVLSDCDAEESADELGLGLKCHRNPELAGSARNALRCDS